MPTMTTIYTKHNWEALMKAWHAGQRCEIDEGVFNYFLEVLPPIYMNRLVKVASGETVRASFGFAEGEETITAFWEVGSRFFLEKTAIGCGHAS